jgi:RNA polymerase sigma-70 factor (ECF subfamily)
VAAPYPVAYARHDDGTKAGAETPVADEVLVHLISQGDQTAFEEIYRRYFKRIYHFVDRRLNNRADAEETVQEVFFNVFNAIESYRGEAAFAAWIFGITRRTIASRFKRKQHPTVPLMDEEGEGGGLETATGVNRPPTPDESYEYRERIDTIQRLAENHLTEEQRTLFELHHIQELSINEIARTLRKSENSVKSNLYRTRKILLAR